MDDYNREAPAIEIDYSFPSTKPVKFLKSKYREKMPAITV
jgi:hypothetical protein